MLQEGQYLYEVTKAQVIIWSDGIRHEKTRRKTDIDKRDRKKKNALSDKTGPKMQDQVQACQDQGGMKHEKETCQYVLVLLHTTKAGRVEEGLFQNIWSKYWTMFWSVTEHLASVTLLLCIFLDFKVETSAMQRHVLMDAYYCLETHGLYGDKQNRNIKCWIIQRWFGKKKLLALWPYR